MSASLTLLLVGLMAAALDDDEEEEDNVPEAAAPAGLSAGLLEEALASDDASACLTWTDSDGPPLCWPPWTADFSPITVGRLSPLVPICPLGEAQAEGNGGVAVGGCSAPPSSEALACALDPDLWPCHARRGISARLHFVDFQVRLPVWSRCSQTCTQHSLCKIQSATMQSVSERDVTKQVGKYTAIC